MINLFVIFFLLFSSALGLGQTTDPLANVLMTYKREKTSVGSNETGDLLVNVSPADVEKFKTNGLAIPLDRQEFPYLWAATTSP